MIRSFISAFRRAEDAAYKKEKKAALVLPVLLAGSGVVMACVGVVLKAKWKDTGRYEGRMALAVPFLVMQDQESLAPTQPLKQGAFCAEASPSGAISTAVGTDGAYGALRRGNRADCPPPVYGEEESWFDDALFIGDSRMVGAVHVCALGGGGLFCRSWSQRVSAFFSRRLLIHILGETDLESLLCSREYGKIYIMLGLNEAGYDLDSLKERYRQDVGRIQELQPDAGIYVLQVYGVSREKAKATDYLRPERLGKINADIQSLCDGEQVRCLDPRALYEDDEGYLRGDYSADGVHPYGKYDALLAEWLCKQAANHI